MHGRTSASAVRRLWTRRHVVAAISLVTGCSAGALAAGALVTVLNGYRATHRYVAAEVIEEASIVANVTWQGESRVRHSAWVRQPLDHISSDRARIWVDREGRPAPRPPGPTEITFGFLLSGLLAGWPAWLTLSRLRLLRHWWVAKKAVRKLDEQWRDLIDEHRSPPDAPL
ncbi:hypothetical protein ACIHFD_57415 [Nonomuraea sp. NPDC051941]|uniref:hypothetical protein n=1 Tax=Nonomuraea sp. NPDC051941 TaxID=3364373 RepID=UPI0037C57EFD